MFFFWGGGVKEVKGTLEGGQKSLGYVGRGGQKSFRYSERGGQKSFHVPKLKFSSPPTKVFMNGPLVELAALMECTL